MTQKELTDSLDLASRQYYNGQQTRYSDTEFDFLLKELQKMERESGIIYPNSPTLRVGSDLQDGFKKGTHPKPMYTIENVYDDDGLEKWIEKMVEEYKVDTFNVSVKYDGISCELHYIDGIFVQALTRGDKMVGDDITENVRTIWSVPMKLNNVRCYNHDFYVRGEILLPKSKLDEINRERIENGEAPFSNTRNACSGSIKQLDPKVTAKRGLIFRAWDCFGDMKIESMGQKTRILRDCGFYYETGTAPATVCGKENVVFWTKALKNTLPSVVDFDYDGIVVKVDSIEIQDEIGTKDTRAIEWGIARKWNEEYIAETILEGVDWQVGRTGVLTPVGRLRPVECGGVIVSNVTLNNWDFIESFGVVHIGSKVKITRSGGVIPYVLDIEDGDEMKNEILPPSICPCCHSVLTRDGALLKCTNKHCPEKEKGRIIQFCSKDCMDVRSIGESVVEDLYDKNLVKSISDLYTLNNKSVEELIQILGEGYGKKKVQKILDEIEKSKEQPWERVLAGLSIPGVGKVIARTLSKEFGAEAFLSVTETELSSIDGIGDIIAQDIVEWWHDAENIGIYNGLKAAGLSLSRKEDHPDMASETEGHPLDGMAICFTGSSSKFSGDDVERFLEENGAKCTHSVSKKLNYLITGDKPGGSKIAKAKEIGVEIIEEDEFYKKYNLF